MFLDAYPYLLHTATVDNDHLFKYTTLKNQLYVKKLGEVYMKKGNENTGNGQWEKMSILEYGKGIHW